MNDTPAGQPRLLGSSGPTLREAFGQMLAELGEEYSDLIVLDADVAGGTGTHHFRSRFPDRFLQVGIAEQNMLTVAAGLALTGWIPVATTFAVFALRAVEQVRQSIAYPNLNVKLVASHPGLDAGPDGASAQAIEDLAVFRAIPNMVVLSPADRTEVRQATRALLEHRGPVYMRTGRSASVDLFDSDYRFEIGRGKLLCQGNDVTLVGCGVEVARCLEAARQLKDRGIAAAVVNLSTLKPVDRGLLLECAQRTGCFVTAEDHNIVGGLGSAVAELLVQTVPCPVEFIGVQDLFGESGEPGELAEKYGIGPSAIVAAACRVIARKRSR